MSYWRDWFLPSLISSLNDSSSLSSQDCSSPEHLASFTSSPEMQFCWNWCEQHSISSCMELAVLYKFGYRRSRGRWRVDQLNGIWKWSVRCRQTQPTQRFIRTSMTASSWWAADRRASSRGVRQSGFEVQNLFEGILLVFCTQFCFF